MSRIPLYSCRLVREGSTTLPETTMSHPGALVAAATAILADQDRECFLVLFLTARHRLSGMHVVSVGDLTSSIVSPREVFKSAILASACKIAVAHNHPSGDPSPSAEDLAVTRKLQEAGKLLGIELLDHVIIGYERHVSLRERGLIR